MSAGWPADVRLQAASAAAEAREAEAAQAAAEAPEAAAEAGEAPAAAAEEDREAQGEGAEARLVGLAGPLFTRPIGGSSGRLLLHRRGLLLVRHLGVRALREATGACERRRDRDRGHACDVL